MQPSEHVSNCNKPVQAKSTCKHAGQKKNSHLPNAIKKCPGTFCKKSHFIMVCRLIIAVEQQPPFLFSETHNAHNHRDHTAYTNAVECGKSSTLKKPECLKMVCHTHNVTIFIEVHGNCLSSVQKCLICNWQGAERITVGLLYRPCEEVTACLKDYCHTWA